MPYYEIAIPFDPNITIGPITLAWHALFASLGILLGYWIARRYAPWAGVTFEDVDTIAVWSILSGIIGARVIFVIDNWELFRRQSIEGIPRCGREAWPFGAGSWAASREE